MHIRTPLALFIALMLGFCSYLSPVESSEKIIIKDVGFATPESVEYYAKEDVYLVTNINGNPLAKDNNGFVSKVAPDGKILDLKWLDGTKANITLHAPKGAAIAGKFLFIADIDHVQVFNLTSGQQSQSIHIPGSTFLNGITPGHGEAVYVTDSGFTTGFKASGSDAIYKVHANGSFEKVYADQSMGAPNGIWDDGDNLLIVTFKSGKVYRISKSGKQTLLPDPPGGSLDGLVKLSDGRYLISGWDDSVIYSLHKDKQYSIFASDVDAPADMGVDSKRNRLLIPLFKQDAVLILSF